MTFGVYEKRHHNLPAIDNTTPRSYRLPRMDHSRPSANANAHLFRLSLLSASLPSLPFSLLILFLRNHLIIIRRHAVECRPNEGDFRNCRDTRARAHASSEKFNNK